jgi:hypothetical protein
MPLSKSETIILKDLLLKVEGVLNFMKVVTSELRSR